MKNSGNANWKSVSDVNSFVTVNLTSYLQFRNARCGLDWGSVVSMSYIANREGW